MTQSFWIDGAVETKPDLSELVSKGYPTNGSPAKGQRATKPGAAWFYLMSLVRAQLIAACGVEENPEVEDQYINCLKSMAWVPNSGISGEKIADGTIALEKLADGVLSSLALPTGTLMAFAGNSVPPGWLLCNGANVSRTTYSKLFAAIGTRWGAGDGVTTFTLPNADGRVLQGTNDLSKVGEYLEAQLPNITGELFLWRAAFNIKTQSGALRATMSGTSMPASFDGAGDLGLEFDASASSGIYADGASLQPSALQTMLCIRF